MTGFDQDMGVVFVVLKTLLTAFGRYPKAMPGKLLSTGSTSMAAA
jgi:hypothetical protein